MHFFERSGSDTSAQTRFLWEEYRYDALGRRILKRSEADTTCTATFCKSSIQRFVYDGAQIVYEISVPGGMNASTSQLEADTATGPYYGVVGYVHMLGIDAPAALDRNGLVIIPHMNFRGLYDAGSDTTGADCCATVDWVGQERTPFLDLPPKIVNGWAGSLIMQQQDASGLMYRRNRYYDPNTGQFTQSDPIGLAGGSNTYGYGNGDPVNGNDPFGLCDCGGDSGGGLDVGFDSGDDGGGDGGDGGDGGSYLGPSLFLGPVNTGVSNVCGSDAASFIINIGLDLATVGMYDFAKGFVKAGRDVTKTIRTGQLVKHTIEGKAAARWIANGIYAPSSIAMPYLTGGTPNPFDGITAFGFDALQMLPGVGAGVALGNAYNSCFTQSM